FAGGIRSSNISALDAGFRSRHHTKRISRRESPPASFLAPPGCKPRFVRCQAFRRGMGVTTVRVIAVAAYPGAKLVMPLGKRITAADAALPLYGQRAVLCPFRLSLLPGRTLGPDDIQGSRDDLLRYCVG